jgi:hypothetical protein
MVGDEMHIHWEKRLHLLVDLDGGIGPPKERLNKRRPVIETNFQLHIRLAGVEADAMHALHARHRIVVAAPHSHRPILFALDLNLDRHKGCRPVMLRPVELDAA